jgi:hypothetical protein
MLKKMLVLGFLLPALGGCFFDGGGRGGRGRGEGGHSHRHFSRTVDPAQVHNTGSSLVFQSSARIGTN